MGIPGLTNFMEKKFTSWGPVDLKALDGVFIDGYDICYTLYKYNHSWGLAWGLGGEHEKFEHTVEKFFKYANFKKPIVIFDGVMWDINKAPLLRHRRSQCIKEM